MTRIDTLARTLEVVGFTVLALSAMQKYASRSYVKINNDMGIALGIVALAVAAWLTGKGFPMVN